MTSKITKIIAAVAIFSAIMVLHSSTLFSWAYAQSGDENVAGSPSSIAALKQESLSNRQIFDRYLIPYEKSQTNIDYFGGIEQAKAAYNHMNDLLSNSAGDEYMEKVNGGAMLIHNFHTLTNTTEDAGRIAALVISEHIQNKIYQQPRIEPLQKLHKHLLDEYPTTGTAEDILTGLFGEMKVLTPEILEVLEMYALFGKPPSELFYADVDYWLAVGSYGHCTLIEEGNSCDRYLIMARERSWDQPPPEGAQHIDPPGVERHPLMPKANASYASSISYSPINYYAEVFTRDCQKKNVDCIYYKKQGASTGYRALSYSGTDHVMGRYVVAYMHVTPTSDDAYYALALAEHWPGGTHKADLDTAYNGNEAIASQSSFIGNSYTAVVTYEDGARFAGYALE